jgi:hypothetical protein
MENMPKSKIEMHTLLLCTDVPFSGLRAVFSTSYVSRPKWSIGRRRPWR